MTNNIDEVQPLDEYVKSVLLKLAKANQKDDEDPEQQNLVSALQSYREMILNVATRSYLSNPGNPKLLEGLTAMLTQLEKSVRDDRKEKQKKKDQEDNKVSFNQLVEAMTMLTQGTIETPSWGGQSIFFEPDESVMSELEDIKVKDAEVSVGRVQLDMDGEEI